MCDNTAGDWVLLDDDGHQESRGTALTTQETPSEPTTGELLKGIADDATTLFRQEILLARQEMQEGLTTSAKAGALLAAAGVLGLYVLGFLLYTIGVAIGGPEWLGFAIVTAVLLVVVLVLALLGRRRMAAAKVAPERAKAQLQATATELKEEIKWARPQPRPPERSS
jgi:Putative Actinobacterial Holin-X, holin superfamily III